MEGTPSLARMMPGLASVRGLQGACCFKLEKNQNDQSMAVHLHKLAPFLHLILQHLYHNQSGRQQEHYMLARRGNFILVRMKNYTFSQSKTMKHVKGEKPPWKCWGETTVGLWQCIQHSTLFWGETILCTWFGSRPNWKRVPNRINLPRLSCRLSNCPQSWQNCLTLHDSTLGLYMTPWNCAHTHAHTHLTLRKE